jgi:hypothetical protein
MVAGGGGGASQSRSMEGLAPCNHASRRAMITLDGACGRRAKGTVWCENVQTSQSEAAAAAKGAIRVGSQGCRGDGKVGWDVLYSGMKDEKKLGMV